MRALTITLTAALLAACSSTADQPGSPDVYARIASTSDCATLQGEFDTASSNHDRAPAGSPQAEAATGYMKASDQRMRDVGCY